MLLSSPSDARPAGSSSPNRPRLAPRRLLIVSTTFFPDPGVAAIRMTQWCRHLPECGWTPHVLCRYYGFEGTAEELAAQVHPDVRVEYIDRTAVTGMRDGDRDGVRDRIARAAIGAIQRRRGLSTVFVPDPSVEFWRKHRQHILQRVHDLQPDVILTSSPPHANHDIGLWLSAKTGIPWIADFRDPYLIDERFRSSGLGRTRERAHRRFEETIYRRAWMVTHAIPFHARWARRQYPFARSRIRMLTNGFPEEMLPEPGAARPAGRRRTIAVCGTIQRAEQWSLAKAVAHLVDQGEDLELRLIGEPPADRAAFHGLLGTRFVARGHVPHAEAVQLASGADILVLFMNDLGSRSWQLSMKLLEYLATGRPIVAINPSRSDRVMLRRFRDARVVWRPDLDQLTDHLAAALRQPPVAELSEARAQFRSDFTWAQRSRQLAAWLDDLVRFPPASAAVHTAAPPAASVVLATRNRRDLLRTSIRSALAQTVPVDVIVMDDGSTDGTAEMVRDEFPGVRLYALGAGRGPCFQRNRGIELAAAEITFPLDDDSVFSTPYVVEQTLREFADPRIAAVGIPLMNPRVGWTVYQRAPTPGPVWVCDTFVGAAHAVRRSVFLAAGGYREHFFYMGEESDLCVRLLDRGYVVRLGSGDPIHHLESPRRNLALANYCARRNDVMFAWHNVPTRFLPIHLIATTVNGALSILKWQNPSRILSGIAHGHAEIVNRWRQRRPVSVEGYRLHRALKKSGPYVLSDIVDQLPAVHSTVSP